MAIINQGGKGTIGGTVIAVDSLAGTVQFCSPESGGNTLVTNAVPYEARSFDADFFAKLGEAVKEQLALNPKMDVDEVSLILPDQLFLLDTVSIPVIHRKAMQQSLSVAVETIYRNAAELNLMTYPVAQTKQTMTFGLVGVRHDLLDLANKTLVDAEAPVSSITFASNAMVNGAMALNAKLRGETFLLLDIKRDYARYALVVRGCTMGYYDLPFGYGMMHESDICIEDALFDHSAAELLVYVSREKARAKEAGEGGESAEIPDVLPLKTPKKLPGFMLRAKPEDAEGYIYENFRIFLKWALELINNNRDITSIAKIDTIYINMPDRYRFLFDVIKTKHEGRGTTFLPLLPEGSELSLAENLELYGGFHTKRYNTANTF